MCRDMTRLGHKLRLIPRPPPDIPAISGRYSFPHVKSPLTTSVRPVRSRGSFGDQAIHELYPKLLKRLDDSSDSVRATVCATLETFLVCAPAQHYRCAHRRVEEQGL